MGLAKVAKLPGCGFPTAKANCTTGHTVRGKWAQSKRSSDLSVIWKENARIRKLFERTKNPNPLGRGMPSLLKTYKMILSMYFRFMFIRGKLYCPAVENSA